MFVSSYNTYIQPSATQRVTKEKEQPSKSGESFASKFLEQPKLEPLLTSTLPVDYVNKAKSFNNKLEMKRQEEALNNSQGEESFSSKDLTKEFASRKILQSAKTAYEDNSKMFSIYKQPQHTLDQTPTADKELPQNIQKLKEENMRRKMVNTYIQNDNYYKVTA